MSRAGLAVFLAASSVSAEPRIASVEPGAITVVGVAGPGDELRITVAGDDELPAVAGTVETRAGAVVFAPAFPFSPRVEYRVELGPWSAAFRVGAGGDLGARAEVVAVYPSGDALPQNLLRFYVHFSRPMSRGEAYEHIRLLDGDGEAVADPFLELSEELWDAENRRLTVFFDPGRVKRGLKPHLEAGPPLVAGRRYRLEIDAGWKDAERRPMAKPFSKGFRTVAPDYQSPDPATWGLEVPGAGTREPLVVTFDSALDHGLLGRLLQLQPAGSGGPLAGETAIVDRETRWVFVPGAPWRAGGYRLLVGSALEDLAGNSVARPFEVTGANPGRDFVGPTVSREFEISE